MQLSYTQKYKKKKTIYFICFYIILFYICYSETLKQTKLKDMRERETNTVYKSPNGYFSSGVADFVLS